PVPLIRIVTGQRPGAMGVAEDDERVVEAQARGDLAHRAQAGAAQLCRGDLGVERAEPSAVERGDGERKAVDERPPAQVGAERVERLAHAARWVATAVATP